MVLLWLLVSLLQNPQSNAMDPEPRALSWGCNQGWQNIKHLPAGEDLLWLLLVYTSRCAVSL